MTHRNHFFRRCAGAVVLAALLALPVQAAGQTTASLPEVVAAPLLLERPLPASPPVDEGWFADAVFIGDSRTEGLQLYSTLKAGLWLTQAGLNVRTARTQDSFTVGERKVSLQEALEGRQWGKIYLMLGVNEASWMEEEVFCTQYSGLIDDLRALEPGAQIYIQTLIPVTVSRAAAREPGNEALARRSELLRELAREKRVYLVDVAAAFTGSNGALPKELSTDGLHLTTQGHHVWIDYLRTHTVDG